MIDLCAATENILFVEQPENQEQTLYYVIVLFKSGVYTASGAEPLLHNHAPDKTQKSIANLCPRYSCWPQLLNIGTSTSSNNWRDLFAKAHHCFMVFYMRLTCLESGATQLLAFQGVKVLFKSGSRTASHLGGCPQSVNALAHRCTACERYKLHPHTLQANNSSSQPLSADVGPTIAAALARRPKFVYLYTM